MSAQEAETAFLRVLDGESPHSHAPCVTAPSPLPARDSDISLGELGGLLALDDAEFVDAAFRALLGREADPEGRDYYRRALAGGRSRVLVLGDLRYGAEGRARARPVPGLRRRHLLHRLYRLGMAGRALRTLTGIVALPGLLTDVERLWREIAVLGGGLRELSAMAARVDRLDADVRREASDADRRQRHAAEQLMYTGGRPA